MSDTGIGIAREDHERIFKEFTQVENRAQRKVRGTGLGLPLSKRLAQLLGGRIELSSAPGVGSTFSVVLPAVFESRPAHDLPAGDTPRDPDRLPVLIVEDGVEDRVIYDRLLHDSPFEPLLARTIREAYQWLDRVRPAAIVLDVRLHGQDAWPFLADLRRDERTREVPLIVISAIDEPRKGLALGADDYLVKPVARNVLIERLRALVGPPPQTGCVLIVDDDAAARYVIARHVAQQGCAVLEATDGEECLRTAAAAKPSIIVLDLTMPGMSGPETLRRLRSDARTSAIPVLIATSAEMGHALSVLGANPPAVLSKSELAGPEGADRLRQALIGAGLPMRAREVPRHAG